jgi:hypothetical protein
VTPADPFDPTGWPLDLFDARPLRLGAAADPELFALLDAADFAHFSRWCWYAKGSRGSANLYLCRTQTVRSAAGRADRCLYLHVEVMRRSGVEPPSSHHVLVDHRNGDTLDCQRANLRWATRSMNVRNIRGSCPIDIEECGRQAALAPV